MAGKDSGKLSASLSRRSFLTAGRVASDPWSLFCAQVRRLCAGAFTVLESEAGFGRARLLAQKQTDIHHALSLCRRHGVVLALDTPGSAARTQGSPVLWVSYGQGLSGCQTLQGDDGAWFAQPGCLLGTLSRKGFGQFDNLPADLTLADYLLGAYGFPWRPGQTAASGLIYASALLADSTRAGLGPFGERNTKPLEGMRLQRLISALFQVQSGPLGQSCLQSAEWPARYRLDALAPAAGFGINLAHLLLAQCGELAWVEWVVLQPRQAPTAAEQIWRDDRRQEDQLAEYRQHAAQLNRAVKQLFDPDGLFPALRP